ncbi:hypothetical protein AKJ53_01275 [candidate division MSBL1 archaeon SCGC-AAA382F02]|uniref:Sodium/calcium exchanger membrane region domain-containing protein n=1 Tax=candidate division MSBL1 archaeon SCGC-AAA382F02 TaxID=1698282 RepID=A0A133VI51_9EURY|nr:hypothetical protein AKJ53_01275 [candidate division MSBL1 archaeon SCGC-AAA382F02]
MWFSIAVIIICLVVFERASNYLIEGLGALSHHFDISEAVLGASIAAMGSSAPEFGSSVFSVIEGHPTIGLGTIVGSAIFNITVIIGGAGLLGKCAIEKRVFYRDGFFYLFTVIVAMIGVWDGTVSRFEALIWSMLFITYLAWLIYDAKKGKPVPKESFTPLPLSRSIIYIGLGILAIGVAAHYLVIHVAQISAASGVSKATFSLVIIAAGTSIPDLFVSLQAARKGMSSLAISNALGSNIFDILAGLGIPLSLRTTTEIEARISTSLIVLLASVGLILAMMRFRWSISKKEAGLLLVVYGVYLVFILLI